MSANSPSFFPQPDHRFAFFKQFLSKPKEVGSIIPSSRFMERRVVKILDLAKVKLVVELGPGTGGTTKAALRALNPKARLLAIEINPSFVRLLQEVGDERLIAHHGSATEISQILSEYGLGQPDVIFSGIPFSTMPESLGQAILKSAAEALAPGGRFVAYQFRDRVHRLGVQIFGPAARETELLNVPPMRIWSWTNSNPEASAQTTDRLRTQRSSEELDFP